jgi:hypothetical protein
MQNPSQEIWTSSCFMQYPSQQIFNFKSFHATSTRTKKFLHQAHFLQYPSQQISCKIFFQVIMPCTLEQKEVVDEKEKEALEKHHCTQIGAKNHTNPSMIMMLQTQLVAEELGSYTLTDFWVCRFVCCV